MVAEMKRVKWRQKESRSKLVFVGFECIFFIEFLRKIQSELFLQSCCSSDCFQDTPYMNDQKGSMPIFSFDS